MLDSPSDNDDLSPMQVYVIAGGVILLFGLLYGYLNHGWNGETALATAQAPTHQRLMLEEGKFSADAVTATTELDVEVSKPSVPVQATVTPSVTPAVVATTTAVAPQMASTPAPVVQQTGTLEAGAVGPAGPAPVIQVAAPQTTAYTLPDGTSIDIGNSSFGATFRDAIANHQTDKPIVFEGIQFDSGSSKPNVASGQPLKVVIALLHANPSIKLLIRGHTDEVGAAKDNTELSLVRANEVGVALVQAGIDRKRLRIMGMGSSEPISIDNTDSARQRNRRIDAVILK